MIHPSGIETNDFRIYEPNRLQIANAVRVKDYPLPPKRFPWFALVLFLGSMVGLIIMVVASLR